MSLAQRFDWLFSSCVSLCGPELNRSVPGYRALGLRTATRRAAQGSVERAARSHSKGCLHLDNEPCTANSQRTRDVAEQTHRENKINFIMKWKLQGVFPTNESLGEQGFGKGGKAPSSPHSTVFSSAQEKAVFLCSPSVFPWDWRAPRCSYLLAFVGSFTE